MFVERVTLVTVFSGAALLFLVQPLIARQVLPVLGGSAQVWNTCMVFFQLALLAGYLYAHWLTKLVGRRGQMAIHLLLLILAGCTLPIDAAPGLAPPTETSPVAWLLALLVTRIGPSFLALAATAPLVQRWFAASDESGAEDPYFLYAVSNVGSLLALLAYPLLLEPRLALGRQALLWSGGFGLFVLLLAGNAWLLLRRRSAPSSGTPEMEEVPDSTKEPGGPVSLPTRARWLLLAFVPSSLLLGVTAHMTQEVPSTPLLWSVPLSLYLASFALAFARRPLFPQRLAIVWHPLLLAVLAIVLFVPTRLFGFTLHLGAFFVSARVLHGELARRRPAPGHLTGFYLWLAAGGALGGVFNALLAPILFPFVAEYPLAVVAAALLHPSDEGDGEGEPKQPWTRRLDFLAPGILAACTLTVLVWLPRVGDARDVAARVGVLFVSSAVALSFRRRPRRFGLGLAAVLLGGFVAFRLPDTLSMRRSYYGSYRVVRSLGPTPSRRVRTRLFHGTTVHGAVETNGTGSTPLAYFHPRGTMGRFMKTRAPRARRLGVIGLGVGSLAWYLRPGQRLRYFEVDSVVRDLARDPALFPHLAEAGAAVEVVLGDGRRSLAREPDGAYDLLFADAFSSDAVPLHLLTREAVTLYLRKLAPGGALLFNTSNRHVRLEAVVSALVHELGLFARACTPPPLDDRDRARGVARASWVMAARTPEQLAAWLPEDPCWKPLESDPTVPVWSDDHASLLPVLRW